MAGIFISYRRDDAAGDARGLYEGLARRFGKSNVFMDVDHLLAGQRFDRELEGLQKSATVAERLAALKAQQAA